MLTAHVLSEEEERSPLWGSLRMGQDKGAWDGETARKLWTWGGGTLPVRLGDGAGQAATNQKRPTARVLLASSLPLPQPPAQSQILYRNTRRALQS